MSAGDGLLDDSAEDLFENAPCGYLATDLDGTILKVNRTFVAWTGLARDELLAGTRFQDLLSPGGRIYHETHYSPLLRMQGSVSEIAVEIVRADGSRLPALVNSVVRSDSSGRPRVVRTTVFDASDRRRYERELLRAQRREQDIARKLQRSLLEGALPGAPGLDVGFVYRPGVSGTEAGGDWYDAFWLEEGESVALVVGDVVGRGIEAAATMGQLRSAVRALAATGLGPGALLGALDGYAHRHRVGRMATLVCAWLDLRTRELRFACAGHPPPVLVRPGERPAFAWEGRSRPLDAHLTQGAERWDAVYELPSGSALLLYTDGLVERRSRPLAAGMDRLLDEVAARAGEPAEALASDVVRALHDPGSADDVCVLAARVGGAPAAG